jgi:transposase InsO family protein
MKLKKKRSFRQWTVAEKLEAVQARQKGLTFDEISGLYGVSYKTLKIWEKSYEEGGIAGLEQATQRCSVRAASPKVESAEKILAEVTPTEVRAGVGKIQGALYRNGFLNLARETVRKLLRRNGHGPLHQSKPRRNKPKQVRHFERATPNEMWQTDIMSFMLKGQYRAYLIGFMDDHSRFLVGWGLYRFQTAANVMEVFRAGIEKHGMPKEVLSDNGRQYYTWRGKSKFTEFLTKLGIRHIRSRPYHPQTLGKIESFWRNLFQECLSQLPLSSFEEAQEKIGAYIEYYNFKRPHQGIGNLMPADRFYKVGDQVKQLIEENTARMEEKGASSGDYTPPAYLVGNLGGRELRVIAKEAQVSLTAPGEKLVESGSGGSEVTHDGASGKISEGQTAQPAGEAGPDSPGAVAGTVGGGALPAGGDLAGAVLPVDETGAGSGPQSSGVAGAGAESALSDEPGGTTLADGEKDQAAGEEKPEALAAEGSPGGGGSDLAADHPAAGLGA